MNESLRRTFCRFVALSKIATAVALMLSSAQVSAQEMRSVSGRVVRVVGMPTRASATAQPAGGNDSTPKADSTAVVPVPSVMVTLHRVGRNGDGAALDSMRTGANGSYRFRYQTAAAPDGVYFTSVQWGGIAYFTAPLRTANVSGNDAEITVFDSTSKAFPLKVSGRHLIISAADSTNHRTVVEVFELSNDSIRTLVSLGGRDSVPTWSVLLPKEARDVKAADGEVAADAFRTVDGRVAVFSAIAPGLKQVSFSYKLPIESFPLPFVVEQGAVVLEVLLEDPMGSVVGGGLQAADPVTLENRNFVRFLAQDVAPNATVEIRLPQGPSVGRNLYIGGLLGAIGTIMLLILWRAMQRKKVPTYVGLPPVREKEIPLADRLAREIADLDATFARYETPTAAVKAAYEERRAELKDALAAELAKR